MGLYQLARPTTLDAVVGNTTAVAAIRRAAESDHRSHCYLLTGGSGQGKTTIARIAANLFGCKEINIEEINAASTRGIDMSRELEKRALTTPLGGGIKTVILDEAACLTRDAQGALLKVLEDIPPHVYYFLCTTDPNRLLPTIRTRCEPIEVKPLDDEQMFGLLARTVEQGLVSADPGDAALDAIVQGAGGSARRALVLLEQIDGLPPEQALAMVAKGVPAEKELLDLCRAIIKGQWSEAVRVYGAIEDKDPEGLRRGVLGYLKSALLKSKSDKEAAPLADKIEELAKPTWDCGEAGFIVMIYRACRVGGV